MGDRAVYREFGKKLADLRHKAGLTQAQLARRIGASRASLANIERGEQRVYLHQMLAISSTLELQSMDDLVPTSVLQRPYPKSDVTMSGDKLSKAQERAIRELVSSITSTSRRTS